MLRMIGGSLSVAVLSLCGLLAWVGGAEAVTEFNSFPRHFSVPGTYRLTANVEADGVCVEVAADFVTIDLNGFEIRGDLELLDVGIVDSSNVHKGTIVRNGTITAFLFGVFLLGPGTVVDNVKFAGNGAAVLVGTNATVKNNAIHDNIGGIVFLGGSGSAINNVISNNGSAVGALEVDATGQVDMIVKGNTIARTATGIVSWASRSEIVAR